MTDTFDPTRVTWVLDPAAVERLMAALAEAPEVSFDLETTGLNEFHSRAKIVLASFSIQSPGNPDEIDTWLLPLYHPESPWLGSWRLLYRRAALACVGKFLMAHNGKFDCRWTYHHTGVDLSGSLQWDSRVSAHSLDETRSTKLKIRAPETFGVPPWDDFDLSEDEAALRVPLIDLGLYAARDTYWTLMLCLNHRERMFTIGGPEHVPMDTEEIEEARLGRLSYWCTMPTTRTLTKMEQHGIILDDEWVRDRLEGEGKIREENRAYLVPKYDIEGSPSFAATSHWFKAFTEKAVEKGDLRVTAVTKNGNPQWNKAVLIRQARDGSEVAQRLLDLRGAMKKIEFLTSWLGYQRPDGAIHCQYNVGSLITGRLSSQAPNMQQITKVLRPAFIPRPGFVIADFDYSQIELRVAAFISRCIPMIEAFQRGDDLHTMLAGRITAKESRLDLVTPDERQKGKSANFGLLYQMSAGGFRTYAETVYDVSFTREEAFAIHAAFFEMWDGMREWHNRAISRAHSTGQVTSPIGRVRRLPGIFSNDDGVVSHAERAAINAPVQGFASDLMQIAAASIQGYLPGHEAVKDAHLVATVHDSIVAELPEDRWEEVAEQCMERMTVAVLDVLKKLDCDFDVPIVAEATVGTRWSLKDIGEMAA